MTVVEQELPEHFELANGVVRYTGCLISFYAFDTDAHVCFGDHVDIVGPIAYG